MWRTGLYTRLGLEQKQFKHGKKKKGTLFFDKQRYTIRFYSKMNYACTQVSNMVMTRRQGVPGSGLFIISYSFIDIQHAPLQSKMKIILHALKLNIHNKVTYIYHSSTVSSIFYSYGRYTLGFLI